MNQGYGAMAPMGDPSQAMQMAGPPMGELRIHTSFFFLMWVLFFVSTRIEINGHVINKPWGWSSFPLPAGQHQVRIAFNYIFGPVGGAMRTVSVYAGHTTVLRYSAPWLIFLSGDMYEAPPQPSQYLMP